MYQIDIYNMNTMDTVSIRFRLLKNAESKWKHFKKLYKGLDCIELYFIESGEVSRVWTSY